MNSSTLTEQRNFFHVKVIELNRELIFPYDNRLELLCPNWAEELQVHHTIEIAHVNDFKGICDFFDGILNNTLSVTKENMTTIMTLSEFSGYNQMTDYISIYSRNIREILIYYINNRLTLIQNNSIEMIENVLFDKYDEIIRYPDILIRMPIQAHHIILNHAIRKQINFSRSDFIHFIIYALHNGVDPQIQTLFSFFDISEFEYDDLDLCSNEPNFDDRYFHIQQHTLIRLIQQNHRLEQENQDLRNQMNSQRRFDEINRKLDRNEQTVVNSRRENQSMLIELNSSLLDQFLQELNNQDLINRINFLHNAEKFKHRIDNQFDGILNYLKTHGTFELSSGAEPHPKNDLKHLFDYSNQNITFFSTFKSQCDENHNWIQFDFKNKAVQLLSYEIKSAPGNPSSICYFHPKSWKIVGSNDEVTWNGIDERIDCSDLRGNRVVGYFECNKKSLNYYRYIRFVQNEEWKGNNFTIDISRFELYGNIY